MKIAVVNGLRGVAICAVVFHHSFAAKFSGGMLGGQLFDTVLCMGWLGVNLFFFLSGLVLYLPYAKEERTMVCLSDAKQFYKRRFSRLFPLFWFVCLVAVVFSPTFELGPEETSRTLLVLASVTYPLHPNTFMPAVNWVLWSVGVEIWFSALFPLLLVAINKWQWRRTALFCFVLAFVARLTGNLLVPGLEKGEALNFLSDSVLGRIDEFLLGMLLADIVAKQSHPMRAWFNPRSITLGFLLIGAAMYGWSLWFRHLQPVWTASLYSLFLDFGLFLSVGTMLCNQLNGTRVLEFRPLQVLGMMCYSIYLWHGLIINRFLTSFNSSVADYIFFLCTTLCISFFTYRFIEFRSENDTRKLLLLNGLKPPRLEGL